MSLRLPETALALAVACGFASLAELCLRRRSRDLLDWNESFLIGAGLAAAVLFPLSLLLPARALETVLVVLAVSAAAVALRTLFLARRAAPEGPQTGSERPDTSPTAVLLFLVIGAAATAFWALDLRAAFAWDGFQIWATKAFLLFQRHALTPEMWPGSVNEARSGRTVTYPNMLPLYEALVASLRGRFDFLGVKPIFLGFYLSMLVSTYRGAAARHHPPSPSPRGEGQAGRPGKRLLARGLPLATVALLALLPTFTSRQSTGGNADLPQAAAVAALGAAWLAEDPRAGRWNSPVPWLLGALLMVKSEGIILFAVACLAAMLLAIGRGFLSKLHANAGSLAVGSILLAGRILYLRWTTVPDLLCGPIDTAHLAQAWERVGLVTRLSFRELADFRQWGFFWPAFFVSSLVAVRWGGARAKVLALATALAVAAYTGIFLFTNLPVQLHVEQAYRRLLTQIAPAAVATLAAAFTVLTSPAAGQSAAETPVSGPDAPGS